MKLEVGSHEVRSRKHEVRSKKSEVMKLEVRSHCSGAPCPTDCPLRSVNGRCGSALLVSLDVVSRD